MNRNLTTLEKDHTVKFSVIIPARNEEDYIEACIKSVKSQDFTDYEIIVVNNGSSDKTAEKAANLGARVIFEPSIGLPGARETGRNSASADILVYLDADMIIPATYLSELYHVFNGNDKVVATTNPYLFYDGNRRIRLLGRLYFKILFPLICRISEILNLPGIVLGGNFAVRKKTLDEIDGFNRNVKFYGEDVEISKRISKRGKIVLINKLYTLSSARRFMHEGISRTFITYLANYFSMLFFNRPFSFPGFTFSPKFKSVAKYAFVVLSGAGLFLYGFVSPKSEIFGHSVHSLNSADKVVALTFDDGPNNIYTEQILDILKEEGVKGTFFLIGKNVEEYPRIARDVVEQGNYVGNHSYSHPWWLSFESRKALTGEVEKAEKAIFNATGVKPALFRPPHGFKTPGMVHTIHKMNYNIITWNDMTTDYYSWSKSGSIAKKIISRARPGSIIVFHDGLNLNHNANRENTVEALKITIDELKKENYRFVSLASLGNRYSYSFKE
jgi:peptidoglycan-N-acetylglucosamine deacetylase